MQRDDFLRKTVPVLALVAVSAVVVSGASYYYVSPGPYVLDTDHYDWAEVHLVYTLTIS